MNNSSWRDDYQKIVAGRAQAYTKAGTNAPWRLYMPFMNVTGNGGMLTTVGDWLKWNAALDAKTFGEPFVTAMETQGVLNDGRKITYALGLVVDEYRGIKAVSHGGSTAGYQTYLTRFPNEKISVAVLCNGTTLNPRGLAMSITDEIFGTSQPSSAPQTAAAKVADDHLKSFAGLWRNEKTRFPARLTAENGTLRFNGQPMRPVSDNVFMLGATQFEFTTNKNGVPVSGESNTNGDLTRFTAQSQWLPTAVELKEFAGEWHSEEAQATFTVTVEGDRAFLTQRPSLRFPLQPLYKDHFMARGYIVWVTRDSSGNIDRLHVGGPRMRDMWFERTGK